MQYSVKPGLYAVGTPNSCSSVFVSADYELSFDLLRRSLQGMNAYILVLDTAGTDVWCAAEKGTFGTVELASRVRGTGVKHIVSQCELIAPQL